MHEQGEHEQQHDAGDLRRAGQAVAVEPGIVDGDGERPHAEELDRADVVQRFHQHERDARGERRPRQWQSHLPERLHGVSPQRPAHFQHAHRLRDEARSRGDVDIRIEHRAHHQDGAAEAANIREPVVPRIAPAEQTAQGGLHHPGIIEHLQIGVGDDIGRDRERQQQQPLQISPSRKAIHGDEPGGAGADQETQASYPGHQQQRAADRAGEHVGDEMRPGIAAWLQRDQRDGEQRQERDQRDEKRRDRPAEIAALFQPGELAAESDALACCALSLGHAVSGGQRGRPESTLRPSAISAATASCDRR